VTRSSRPQAPPANSIETVTSAEALAALEADWNRLSRNSESPNVFTTFDWFRAWNQRFERDFPHVRRRPHVIVVKKNAAVVGIAPLVMSVSSRSGVRVRRLEFVGREADYNDLVVGDGSPGLTGSVIDHLARTSNQWDMADLRELRRQGDATKQLEAGLSRAGLSYRLGPEEERCPFMEMGASWEEMLAARSSPTRHVFRNQQSRIDRLSESGLRVRIVEDFGREPGLLKKMAAIESRKQVGGSLSPPFLGKYEDVFRSLFQTLGPQGWLSAALMELGDRLLAWHLLFRCGRELWGYLTAYDAAFSRLSPGTMLVPAIVEYGCTRQFRVYDFLRGEEPYKTRWTTNVRHSAKFRIFSRSRFSRFLSFAYFDLLPAVERWTPRMRPPQRN
jgi:CelD/BcsL family acetyltransferase involved in cellulose biosynthesis